jgi:hypothetical protein
MCGEIQEWQTARTVSVRLTTNGTSQRIVLNNRYETVEEVRLDECMFTVFNGGVSAGCYFVMDLSNLSTKAVNNESKSGILLMVDTLNPHTVFQRPRDIASGSPTTLTSFQLGVFLPNGTPVTFTEAIFTITFVCRKSEDEIQAVRQMKAKLDYIPSVRDGIVFNTFDPSKKK